MYTSLIQRLIENHIIKVGMILFTYTNKSSIVIHQICNI